MFTRAHRAIYRGTRGLIGGNLLGIQILLLTTRGRKTGQRRTLPLAYVEYKEDLIVVASNGGSDKPPDWWLNLQSAALAEVQINGETFEVTWSEAPQEELHKGGTGALTTRSEEHRGFPHHTRILRIQRANTRNQDQRQSKEPRKNTAIQIHF